MAGVKRSSRRQTRLTFTPLPSSSPAVKDYNRQIQDRAATVTLDSSPAPRKQRDVHNEMEYGNVIPTPAASRQTSRQKPLVEEVSDSGSEPVRSTQRKSGTQTRHHVRPRRQQRLDFSNVRDAESFSPPMKLSSPSRPQSSARAGMFGTQSKRRVVDISSDEEDADHPGRSHIHSDSDEELPSPRKLVAKGRSRKAALGSRNEKAIALDSDSAEDNIVVGSEAARAIEVESEDDEDDDMPTTLGTQRRQKRKRRKSIDSFISSSPPRAIDSDDDIEIVERPEKRKRRNSAKARDEESESEPMTPRRLKPKRSQQETDDLKEDLDFLEPSSDIESPRKKRDTQSIQKNARQAALERLKRRRSKQANEEDDERVENELDDDDDVEEAPRMKSSHMFKEDEYDQDFVEEGEDEDPLGIPDGVPLQFTRYASMKPKELFKHAVEWFVQKKINPAFSRNDGLYELTFRKLDDEVTGLAGSKFKSAAWTSEFTVALNARPQIAYEPLDRTEHWMRDTCDACNRTNHPATYQIQFQGQPYHRETLEDVAQNNEDEDDVDSSSSSGSHEASDEPAYDSYGREVPPETKIFYVGKFCMSNAQTAHALQHWRYHLNEWVKAWLDQEGYNTPNKVVERDRWSIDKRGRYANKLVDRLEREGLVKQLYGEYKNNIDEARESKQGRYSGWE